MYYIEYKSIVGMLYLVADDEYLLSVSIVKPKGLTVSKSHHILIEAKKQLEAYFKGKRKSFDLPIYQKLSEFQEMVYRYLESIEYGKVVSYSEIAEAIQRPLAVRAIANACASNQLIIVVPCHRVIRKNGSLGGYNGGVEMKEKLLEIEGFSNNNVS